MVDTKYWAFLSYSRKDDGFAKRIHRDLERFRVPRRFRSDEIPSGGIAPDRLRPIFRDREELPASSDLGHQLESALRASRHLIVLWSRASASSRWVAREIELFVTQHGWSRVILVVLSSDESPRDGAPLPWQAKEPPVERSELLHVTSRQDIRIEVVARILGVHPAALRGEVLAWQARKRQVLFGASALWLLATAGLGWRVDQKRRVALKEEETAILLRRRSEALLGFLSEELCTRLRELGFGMTASNVIRMVDEYYLDVGDLSEDASAVLAMATAHRRHGERLLSREAPREAEAALRRGLELLARLEVDARVTKQLALNHAGLAQALDEASEPKGRKEWALALEALSRLENFRELEEEERGLRSTWERKSRPDEETLKSSR
jgi:hypothetical protein